MASHPVDCEQYWYSRRSSGRTVGFNRGSPCEILFSGSSAGIVASSSERLPEGSVGRNWHPANGRRKMTPWRTRSPAGICNSAVLVISIICVVVPGAGKGRPFS